MLSRMKSIEDFASSFSIYNSHIFFSQPPYRLLPQSADYYHTDRQRFTVTSPTSRSKPNGHHRSSNNHTQIRARSIANVITRRCCLAPAAPIPSLSPAVKTPDQASETNLFMAAAAIPGFRSVSSWFELYAAFSTFMMLFRTAINDLVPEKVRTFVTTKLEAFFSHRQAQNQLSLTINRSWEEGNGIINELFEAAYNYLPSRVTKTYKSLKIGKIDDRKDLVLAVEGREEVVDEFEGIKFTWKLDDGSENETKEFNKLSFKLSFNEKHREIVIDKYIPYVLATYEAMKAERKNLKLNSWSYGLWNDNELSHPATFDTLGLDPELKQTIIDDLERFFKRKEMYKKVGKPWKRGYLLYGPPGTGKSSLIAAMANYLKFDVYALDLNSVGSNSELMGAMRRTSRRSIIVLEDIDCNKEVSARVPPARDHQYTDSECDYDHEDAKVEDAKGNRFTLSGLLNCVDGLWTSQGEERIIIFTTNHVEKIDPALLRPGRMDMHIHLSFLKAKAFRVLATNYLDIGDHHPLFEQIEELLERSEFTPAEVAEQLIRNENPDVALDELLKFLEEKDMKRRARKAHKNPKFCNNESESSENERVAIIDGGII